MVEKKLKTYHAKRDFGKTPEPKGKKTGTGNSFVVQKHDASHLHYDLRLEVNGVLRSWAVPKGIPTEFNEKRLAIQTEDHPLEYAQFEGVIPAGEYGGGSVKIWDQGEYELLDKEYKPRQTANSALKNGAIKFQLKGKRYKGAYALAKFKTENNKNQWLLFRVAKEK
jgi:DNA ligase D-like protein (predicted 3'-phosphoesterase)